MIQLVAAVSTSDIVRYVNPYDDALDYDASDIERYYETYDLDCLRFKEGKVPTYFHLRPCSQAETRRANIGVASKTPEQRNVVGAIGGELLRIGLIGAENLARQGDSFKWVGGCPPQILDEGMDLGLPPGEDGKPQLVTIPHSVQEVLAVALYQLTKGPSRDGGLNDEGK